MKLDDAKTKTPSDSSKQAFQPKRLSAFSDINRSEIVYIDEKNLIPYEKQARKIFKQEDIDYLAESIKEYGLRQPLTVIRSSSENPTYEVVSGERRLRACRLNGVINIPCIILTHPDQAEEIALVENIQREDLHPLELSDALKALIERQGWTQSDLSKKLSIATSTVSEILGLQKLSDSVRSLLISMDIRGRDELRKLVSMPSAEAQQSYLIEKQKTELLPVEQKNKDRPMSIIRISRDQGVLKIQDRSLYKLSHHDLEEVKEALYQLIEKIENITH